MTELLKKLKGNPLSDNMVDAIGRVLEKEKDLQDIWIPKIQYLVNLEVNDRRSANKWDWMYEKICRGILTYWATTSYLHLGVFDIIQDSQVVGEFKLRLPVISDPWEFESSGEYLLIGTVGDKIEIHTVQGIYLTRWEWKEGDKIFRLKTLISE